MTAINLCCNRKCKETRRFIKSRVGRDSVQVSWHICAASIRPRRCNNAGIQSIQSSRATLNHTHGGPFKRDQGDLSMSRSLPPSLGSFQQMENVWSQDSDPQLLKHKLNGNGIRPTEIAALGGREGRGGLRIVRRPDVGSPRGHHQLLEEGDQISNCVFLEGALYQPPV